jgi:glutamate-1-semialdehyde 2,1-aminomutase
LNSVSHLVGGISSAGRALPPLDGESLLIARCAGPYLWDTQGQRYVDTALGFGGTILGHAAAPVVAAVEEALRKGALPAFAHPAEEAAAAALARQTAPLDRVIFTNSGSEAVHLACRLARAVTGRRRVAKIAGGYDGWYDDVAFGNAGSSEADFPINARPEKNNVVLLRFNDTADTEALFAEDPNIAAVLVEPVLANAGCIMPKPGYLLHLQETARRHGALLIMDEVLMGFRLHAGLTSHFLGLDPDLATVGKAIGSGIAVAALVGRRDIMEAGADGRAIRAGTYCGNPIACAAVVATMAELVPADYPALLAVGDALRSTITKAFNGAGIDMSSTGAGSVFTLWFAPKPPTSYEEAVQVAAPNRTLALHYILRRTGALVMPGAFGRHYLSFAHNELAIHEFRDTLAEAAPRMAAAAL